MTETSAEGSFRWGIYEKALPVCGWAQKLGAAAEAGYQFVEISIDESDDRLGRLEWPCSRRRELHLALSDAPASVDTLCLSAHRRYPLGSESAPVRERGLSIMRRAIDFAAEFGIRVVQVAGYDVFYEASTDRTRALYAESIARSAAWASAACVMLALENVDCPFMDSVEKGMRLVRDVDAPWLQMYPDIGNLVASGRDVPSELRTAGRHIVGVHLKDTRAGEFRRVPFGEGLVDFDAAFRALGEIDFRGPFIVEMWNEAAADPVAAAAGARQWLLARLAGSGEAAGRQL